MWVWHDFGGPSEFRGGGGWTPQPPHPRSVRHCPQTRWLKTMIVCFLTWICGCAGRDVLDRSIYFGHWIAANLVRSSGLKYVLPSGVQILGAKLLSGVRLHKRQCKQRDTAKVKCLGKRTKRVVSVTTRAHPRFGRSHCLLLHVKCWSPKIRCHNSDHTTPHRSANL